MGDYLMRFITIWLALMLSPAAFGQQLERAKGWAWSGIAASTLENRNKPQPAPAPKPGDVCPACTGSGKVGDGRVFQTCRDCNGTGKVPSASAQSFLQSILPGPICVDGRCDLPQPVASLPVQSLPVARLESAPVASQACPGGVCPVPSSAQTQTYRSYQPQVVRRGWIFRR